MTLTLDPTHLEMTTGDVARELREQGHRTPDGRPIRTWMVRRMYELGRVAESRSRVGGYRVVRREDLPLVMVAQVRAGYLAEAPEGVS